MRVRLDELAAALDWLAPPPATVLDFGCGTGDLVRALAQRGWRMTGCDASPAMLAVARELMPEGNWELVEPFPNHPLPFPAASFDAVVASSVFEYLADPLLSLRQIAAILRPKGGLAMTVPDPRYIPRQREEKWRSLGRLGPAWLVLQRTRWRPFFNYLRLSINRFPLEHWLVLLREAGFTPAPPPDKPGPLALLIARKQ
jgi:SAM-dependent methyltransferase